MGKVHLGTTCNICFVEYDELEGNFHRNKSFARKYAYQCKECIRKRARKFYEKRGWEKVREQVIFERKSKAQKKYYYKLSEKKIESINNGIHNLRFKYTWSESGYGWMKSKERISINQYKLVCI